MKYEEQFDAHVKSYKEELKKKERERIKKLFQYLKEKREQLTLNEHPVKKIYYSINMVKPTYFSPLLPEKLSFNSTIELKREKINIKSKYDDVKISAFNYQKPEIKADLPKFSLGNFEFKASEISLNEITLVKIHNKKISYVPEKSHIRLSTFKNVSVYKNTITEFTLPDQNNFNLDIRPQVNLYKNTMPKFALPNQNNFNLNIRPQVNLYKNTMPKFALPNQNNFNLDILPQVNVYKNTMPKFALPDSKINVSMPKKVSIHFEQINYKKDFPKVELTAFTKLEAQSHQYKINSEKFYKEIKVELNNTEVKIPEFNVNFKIRSIPMDKKEFLNSNLDFSEVLKKFQSSLNENFSKDECNEE